MAKGDTQGRGGDTGLEVGGWRCVVARAGENNFPPVYQIGRGRPTSSMGTSTQTETTEHAAVHTAYT